MKFLRLSPAAALLGLAGCLVMTNPSFSLADPPEKKPGDSDGRKSRHHEGNDPFAGLTSEERQQFREAMRRAWTDPAVLQARDEVKAATVTYQKALTKAVSRIDPGMAAIMEKIREASDKGIFTGPPGGGGRAPGKGPGGSGGGSREFFDLETFISGGDSGLLGKLNEEQKAIYRAAREKAVNSAPFQEVLGKFREMRLSDEEMRKKRIDIFRRARQVLTSQMIAADERVKEFIPKRPPQGDSRRGPDSDPGESKKVPRAGNAPGKKAEDKD